MNKKGIVLILSFIVIVVLAILGSVIISRSISESNIARRYAESTQAFWLAEAGVNRVLTELRNGYSGSGTNLFWTSLGPGGYYADRDIIDSRKFTAHGFIPFTGTLRAERIIEVIMSNYTPPNFYDNVIYSAGDVDFNGSSYTVSNSLLPPDDKAVIYAGDFDVQHPEQINGTYGQDVGITPLARLKFQELYNISQGQGNVYDAARLNNVKKGTESFPPSFWSANGNDSIDNDSDGQVDEADEKVNIVYVQGDLTLNGNIGTIGGFFVVVGDVLTNPGGTYDATINGNGQIEGIIYTRGEFRVNGGGGGLNVNGGVWVGEEAELNGNAYIAYNEDYMNAIDALDIDGEFQISSWKDPQNPYQISE